MSASAAREVVIGTRGSALALAQTQLVCQDLQARHPALRLRVERITTTGDARADQPLSQLERGMFVTEIESALRDGRIDAAVHSAKDLPSTLAADLTLAALLPRADARDVVVSRAGALRALPPGSRVGTSSPRRACQIRGWRPDLETVDIRGNVDTRLRKLASGEYDAIVLAAAGLARLGRIGEATEWLAQEEFIPCVGQGALAIETRAGDAEVIELVRVLEHAPTRAAVVAERAFLAELGAGCRAAAAAHATLDGEMLTVRAMIGDSAGRQVRGVVTGAVSSSAHLGRELALELLSTGGAEFLAPRESALASLRVAITRPASQSRELAALLRARGAEPIACPTIEIRSVGDTSELDAALLELPRYDWMAFTSANAVRAVADRLDALSMSVTPATRMAAVGGATARELDRRIRKADVVPPPPPRAATAHALGDALPATSGQRVLFPRGDIASGDLAGRLRQRGVHVDDPVVYRTVRAPNADELAGLVRDGRVDAIIFTSPSSVRFARGLVTTVRAAERGGWVAPTIVCIGPTTARAARDAGLEPHVVAETQSVGGIVEALERWYASRPASRLAPV